MDIKFPLLLSALAIAGSSQATKRPSGKKMNVMMILVDDLRPELGCYGVKGVITPNIDRMASQGATFTRAYCNIPISGASRASLLTGLYPKLPERFASFDAWVDKDAPQAADIAQWFLSNGYTTISNGKIFHNMQDRASSWSESLWRYHPNGYGKDWAEYNKWELWLNDDSKQHINARTMRGPFCESAQVADSLYQDGRITSKTIADLRSLAQKDEPFFLATGFWRPHLPFNAPKKYWDMYSREDIVLAENRFRPEGLPKQVTGSNEIKGYALTQSTTSDEFHRMARHGYYACVSFIDAQVGLILDELRRTGLDKNTIVLLIGDHGWHLGEHEFWGKHNLMNHATNAPMIIVDPRASAQRVTSVVEFVDIFPTLCSAAGIKIPQGVQGNDLTALIEGKAAQKEQYAFIQWGNGLNLVSRDFYYAYWPTQGEQAPTEMLFDMNTDPAQNKNVSHLPQYSAILEQMRGVATKFKKNLK